MSSGNGGGVPDIDVTKQVDHVRYLEFAGCTIQDALKKMLIPEP